MARRWRARRAARLDISISARSRLISAISRPQGVDPAVQVLQGRPPRCLPAPLPSRPRLIRDCVPRRVGARRGAGHFGLVGQGPVAAAQWRDRGPARPRQEGGGALVRCCGGTGRGLGAGRGDEAAFVLSTGGAYPKRRGSAQPQHPHTVGPWRDQRWIVFYCFLQRAREQGPQTGDQNLQTCRRQRANVGARARALVVGANTENVT